MSEESDLGEEEEEEEEEDEEDVRTVLTSRTERRETRAARSLKRDVKAPVGGKAPMGARKQAPYSGVERAPSQARMSKQSKEVYDRTVENAYTHTDDGGGDELDGDADTGGGKGNTKSENAELAKLRKQVQLLKEQKEAADKKAADEKKAHEEEKVVSAAFKKDSDEKGGQIKRFEEMMRAGRENADSKGTVPPHTQPFPPASQNPHVFGSSRAGLFGLSNLQPSPKQDAPNQEGMQTAADAANTAFLQQQNEQMQQQLQQMQQNMVIMQNQIMQQQQQMHPTHTLGMQTPTPQQQGTMVNIGQFCRSAAPGMHNLVPANQVLTGSRMQTFVSPHSTQLGDGQGGSMDVAMALAQEKGRREQEEKAKMMRCYTSSRLVVVVVVIMVLVVAWGGCDVVGAQCALLREVL